MPTTADQLADIKQNSLLTDNVVRGLFTLMTTGTLVAIGLLLQLRLDVAVIANNSQHTTDRLSRVEARFDSFAAEPRFTQQHYELETAPLTIAVEAIKEENRELRDRIRALEGKKPGK